MKRKKKEIWKKITVVTLSAAMVITSGGVYELTGEVGRLWQEI